eukprot:TRINITY_DN40471_c0_g1_i1.p1 TRINITY_DN40471_c0_g1~~TRINITY_DN40471_c0_g1_i1.p1  ORF type:complete len:411 (-),score=105.83 TRINITY_DN40471_c0_g1_i1:369-1553(-)
MAEQPKQHAAVRFGFEDEVKAYALANNGECAKDAYNGISGILPKDYKSLLTPKETQLAITAVKEFIEKGLCEELNLMRVQVPLIVEKDCGWNDDLDRDGSRTPVGFHIINDGEHEIDAQLIQAATKWKRVALKTFDMKPGEGLYTDVHAVRKDYYLDHDHSAFVDQWDWERVITAKDRSLDFLKFVVQKLWKVLRGAEKMILEKFPQLRDPRYPEMPDELVFMHAEDLLLKYPDLPRKKRETAICKELGAVFIYGIGWTLDDGKPHENRAPDYDDWITPTVSAEGHPRHGLNGDILVWNPVTKRRHELSSMGIRVTPETLIQQLEETKTMDRLKMRYHQMLMNNELPLCIGGGIGQSRTYMRLLRKAHLGEVSVTVWPAAQKKVMAEHNIHVLE